MYTHIGTDNKTIYLERFFFPSWSVYSKYEKCAPHFRSTGALNSLHYDANKGATFKLTRKRERTIALPYLGSNVAIWKEASHTMMT